MKPKPPLCFLCRKRRGKYWIHAADFVEGVLRCKGIGVCLCYRCWYRKGLYDMSFYPDVERKLLEIFCPGKMGEKT